MQGVALVGVFLRVAPFAARAGMDRDALMRRRPGPPGALLRQAWWGASWTANLAVIEAAYDGLIDVSAALDLPTARRSGVRSRSP